MLFFNSVNYTCFWLGFTSKISKLNHMTLPHIYLIEICSPASLVKALFHQARMQKPCIILLDDIDVLFGRNPEEDTIQITQILAELDAGSKINENLFIVAATQAPWKISCSFLKRCVSPPVRTLESVLGLNKKEKIYTCS